MDRRECSHGGDTEAEEGMITPTEEENTRKEEALGF